MSRPARDTPHPLVGIGGRGARRQTSDCAGRTPGPSASVPRSGKGGGRTGCDDRVVQIRGICVVPLVLLDAVEQVRYRRGCCLVMPLPGISRVRLGMTRSAAGPSIGPGQLGFSPRSLEDRSKILVTARSTRVRLSGFLPRGRVRRRPAGQVRASRSLATY
jgi:hypothetical protein